MVLETLIDYNNLLVMTQEASHVDDRLLVSGDCMAQLVDAIKEMSDKCDRLSECNDVLIDLYLEVSERFLRAEEALSKFTCNEKDLN